MAKLQVPTLLIYGTTDLQVPVADGEILKATRESAQLVVIEGMNHVLKQVEGDLNDQLSSYADPDLPLHDELMEHIVSFIKN